MHITYVIVFFVFGCTVGSFLNVVVYRLPKPDMSIVRPASHCPICLTPIRWFDNIPVLSYTLLGQLCRTCKSYIPLRYPLVELLTGIAFGYVAWFSLPANSLPVATELLVAVARCGFAAALIAVTFIDIDLRIIPEEITFPAMVLMPALALALPDLHRDFTALHFGARLNAFFASGIGMLVGMGLIGGIRILGRVMFRKEAMGMGDVMLMGLIGGMVGWDGSVAAVVLASFGGMVYGLINLAVTRDRYMPFGPFLALGAFFAAVHKIEILKFVTHTYPDWFFKTFMQH